MSFSGLVFSVGQTRLSFLVVATNVCLKRTHFRYDAEQLCIRLFLLRTDGFPPQWALGSPGFTLSTWTPCPTPMTMGCRHFAQHLAPSASPFPARTPRGLTGPVPLHWPAMCLYGLRWNLGQPTSLFPCFQVSLPPFQPLCPWACSI